MNRILEWALLTAAIMAGVASPVGANQERALRGGGQERILGGVETNAGSGDWAVSLKRNGYSYCGGTLVHPITRPDQSGFHRVEDWQAGFSKARWVVTAAHCLYTPSGRPLQADEITARTGNVDLNVSVNASKQSVIAIIEHPQYDSNTLVNDIALLLIEEPSADASTLNRGSVAMPSRDDTLWINQPYLQTYAMGWGVTEYSNAVVKDLMQVRVPLMDKTHCRDMYQEAGSDILPGMICAGFSRGEFDSCQGDSGGPLVYKSRSAVQNNTSDAVLVGVVSWGIGCALPALPGVYTSVQYFKQWLEQAVEDCLKRGMNTACTQRVSFRRSAGLTRSFVPMISGDISLFPGGCEEDDAVICRLAKPIRYEHKLGLVWESAAWTSDAFQSGTTDGASIPKWAQPIIGKPFDRSYLKAAILHDHYCYEENHVRSWQQVHRMFFDALIDSGVDPVKARTMYYGVLIGGPRWKELVPGEYCGVGCLKSRIAEQRDVVDNEWIPSIFDKDGFSEAIVAFHHEQTGGATISLEQIELRAEQARQTLLD